MTLQTPVTIPQPSFSIAPCERILFVGSCFADRIGQRAQEEKFRAVVNPDGVMYNPASILHTVSRTEVEPKVAFFTLGTNHVYILKETGEIVDNCRKMPQRLFEERELTIKECVDYLSEAVQILLQRSPEVRVVVTVSPIRYAKYGFHGSALSKAVLLLTADALCKKYPDVVSYFPAYEIVLDELRDYRFYNPDMLHPSDQAVEYIWERFSDTYFSPETHRFIQQWRPIKEALAHRPFHPDSPEYQSFLARTKEQARLLSLQYPGLELAFS